MSCSISESPRPQLPTRSTRRGLPGLQSPWVTVASAGDSASRSIDRVRTNSPTSSGRKKNTESTVPNATQARSATPGSVMLVVR